MDEILDNLNKEQIEAVINTEGPILILAGAGTGKTRVLTSKISYIIKSNLAFPSQILSVTFTNKAANEMKDRVLKMTNLDVNSMWIGTFHSISARILRQNGEILGLSKDFLIIDQTEQISIVKQIMKDFNIDTQDYSPKYYSELIVKFKDKLHNDPCDLYMFYEVFDKYNDKLKKNNMCDFSDLINYTIELFTKNKDILKYYNEKFKYIFVDEYQDTNFVQNTWLKLISGVGYKNNINITCVGDDDQSIYGWRGAEIQNILEFEKDFKKSKILKLERNYRSTQNILNTAYSIISKNKKRHKKKLYTNENNFNEKVSLLHCNDFKSEAISIVNEIEILKNKNFINNFKECAILVRASYQTRIFEDIFLKYNIPYIIFGGLKFYERKEIKDCIGYLRLIFNTDDDLAFERIINTPKRGIGQATLNKIKEFSVNNNMSFFKSSEFMISNGDLKGKVLTEIEIFLKNIKSWQKFNGSPKDLMSIVLKFIKYLDFMEKDSETKNRIDNIDEFLNTLEDFENIKDFLEYVSLVNDNSSKNDIDAVNIMTMHAAKGLEFNVVFLPNWQEGIFPSPKSLDENGGLEEERRLAYVAITRARKKLYISNSKYKYEYDSITNLMPSIFIKELDCNYLNIIDNVTENSYNNYYNKKIFLNNENKSKLIEEHKFNFKKCFHEKFGYGYITREDGEKLTISFEKFGEKIILKSFVTII